MLHLPQPVAARRAGACSDGDGIDASTRSTSSGCVCPTHVLWKYQRRVVREARLRALHDHAPAPAAALALRAGCSSARWPPRRRSSRRATAPPACTSGSRRTCGSSGWITSCPTRAPRRAARRPRRPAVRPLRGRLEPIKSRRRPRSTPSAGSTASTSSSPARVAGGGRCAGAPRGWPNVRFARLARRPPRSTRLYRGALAVHRCPRAATSRARSCSSRPSRAGSRSLARRVRRRRARCVARSGGGLDVRGVGGPAPGASHRLAGEPAAARASWAPRARGRTSSAGPRRPTSTGTSALRAGPTRGAPGRAPRGRREPRPDPHLPLDLGTARRRSVSSAALFGAHLDRLAGRRGHGARRSPSSATAARAARLPGARGRAHLRRRLPRPRRERRAAARRARALPATVFCVAGWLGRTADWPTLPAARPAAAAGRRARAGRAAPPRASRSARTAWTTRRSPVRRGEAPERELVEAGALLEDALGGAGDLVRVPVRRQPRWPASSCAARTRRACAGGMRALSAARRPLRSCRASTRTTCAGRRCSARCCSGSRRLPHAAPCGRARPAALRAGLRGVTLTARHRRHAPGRTPAATAASCATRSRA